MTIGINILFTLLMLILATVDVKTYLKNEHKDLKSAILSLGILGTFLGIFIGLMGFDTTNIQQSVPNMLDGLKIAFFTSIAGMTIAVSLFVFQKFKPIESPQDASIEFINKQLQKLDSLEKLEKLDYLEMLKALYHQKEIDKNTKEMSEEVKKLSLHLKSSHQQTYDLLLSSFEHVIGTLKNAIEEISKGASKEIIDALGAVIRDFNTNLNEQFGDNFKELNTGVQNLLEWQHNYKSSVEESEKALKSAANSLSSSKETFELIASKNSDIMSVYRELSLIINTYSNQTKTLNAQLEQYAKLGEKSQEMLTSIDELFKNSQEKYGLLGENFENYIITSKEKIEGLLKEFVEKSYEQNTFLIEQIKTESESSQEQLRGLMQSTTIFFKEELEILNESSKISLSEHSQVLQDINKESVDLYKKHSDKLGELIEDAKEGTTSFKLSLQRVHEDSKALMHEYQAEILQNQERFIESLKEDAKESFKAIEEQNSSSVKEYISTTSELTKESVDSIKDSLQGSLYGFKETQEEMLEHFKETQSNMKAGLDEVKNSFTQTSSTLVDSITNSHEALQHSIQNTNTSLEENIINSQKTLNENVYNSNRELESSIHKLFNSITSDTKESIEYLKSELFSSIEQSVQTAISNSEKYLNSFIDDLSKNSKESQEIIFTILDSVKTSVDSSKEAVDSLSSSAKTSIEQSFESASNAHKLLSQQGSKTLSQLDLLTKKLMIEQKNMLKNSLEEYGGFVEESKESLRSLFSTIDEFNTEFTLKNSETLSELSESTKGSIESISVQFKEHSSKTLDEIKELLDKSSAEYMKTLENNVNEGKDIPIKIAQNIKAAFMQAQKEISAYSRSTNSSILSSKEMAEKLNNDIRNSIKEQVDENKKLNEEMQKGLRILDNSLQNVIMNFKNDYEWFLRRVRELMGADRL